MMSFMPYVESAPDMPLPDALEVVDARNRPLLVMPCADVLRQRLPHRAVALLPHLRQHFFLMRRRSVWDVAGIVPLPAGESCALTAQQLVDRLGLPPCRLSRIALPAIAGPLGWACVAGLTAYQVYDLLAAPAFKVTVPAAMQLYRLRGRLANPAVEPVSPLADI